MVDFSSHLQSESLLPTFGWRQAGQSVLPLLSAWWRMQGSTQRAHCARIRGRRIQPFSTCALREIEGASARDLREHLRSPCSVPSSGTANPYHISCSHLLRCLRRCCSYLRAWNLPCLNTALTDVAIIPSGPAANTKLPGGAVICRGGGRCSWNSSRTGRCWR